MASLKDVRVPAGTLAELLGVGARRLKQLVAANVIPPPSKAGFALGPAIAGYVRFLKASGGREELLTLRVRKGKAQAEKLEFENKVAAAKYVDLAEVQRAALHTAVRLVDHLWRFPAQVEARLRRDFNIEVPLPGALKLLHQEIDGILDAEKTAPRGNEKESTP